MAEKPLNDAENPDVPATETQIVPSDPDAPSAQVSSKRQSLSDIFTIVRSPYSDQRNHNTDNT